jgi:hypothetical protein
LLTNISKFNRYSFNTKSLYIMKLSIKGRCHVESSLKTVVDICKNVAIKAELIGTSCAFKEGQFYWQNIELYRETSRAWQLSRIYVYYDFNVTVATCNWDTR